jgi:catechol 2,3-dioxygenase-like lactoylglutathione lyase family enzyme
LHRRRHRPAYLQDDIVVLVDAREREARRSRAMSVELNHIIIPAKDKRESANFLTTILGLPEGTEWGPFIQVKTSNGVALDYVDSDDIRTQHYAFLVSDAEFEAGLARLRRAEIAYWADPRLKTRSKINHLYGGRGFYFKDPSGHLLELITQPYGETPAE